MCTALLSIEPGLPALLVGVRDELMDRAWEPPGPHWPDHADLIGGRDLQAGGTWLAVAPREHRASCVLNARGQLAPPASRLSRGVLPLRAAAGQPIDKEALANTDPFHLITVEPDWALWQSWDGHVLTERKLGPGLHFAVNSGLAADLLAQPASAANQLAQPGSTASQLAQPGSTANQLAQPAPTASQAENGRAHELARIAHFLPRFQAATRPNPLASRPAVSQPAVSQPAVSQPAVSQPAVSQPAVSQPAVSHPAVSRQPELADRPDAGAQPGPAAQPDPSATFDPTAQAGPAPQPGPAGQSAAAAWAGWFPLLNGDGLSTDDDRALIVRRDLGSGRIWGTTSISLIALSPAGLRYDFTGRPGDPTSWYTVRQD